MMSSEDSIGYHQTAGLKLWKYVFLPYTDSDTVWLCEIGECARKECAIFYDVQHSKDLFSEGFAMFFEKMRNP